MAKTFNKQGDKVENRIPRKEERKVKIINRFFRTVQNIYEIKIDS